MNRRRLNAYATQVTARGCRLLALALLTSWSLFGCAGGIPSVPDDPDAALEKGDRYFQRGKYFQAQEVYKGFLQKHAGHARSDYAQYMLGESYFGEEAYAMAVVEYQILVTNYGYSDYVDDAFLGKALSLLKQAPKTPLDQSICKEARDILEQFIQVFPNSDRLPDAMAALAEVNLKLAKKDFDTMKFYFRGKQYRATMRYVDVIIDGYPQNEYWYRAHFYRGMILRARGDNEGAMRAFNTLVSAEERYKETKDAQRFLKELQQGGN